MSVLVHFACNDPDNGAFLGRVDALHLSVRGSSIDFDLHGRPPTLTVGQGWFRFLRRRYPFHGYSEWVGNWCWNAYRLTDGDAAALTSAAIKGLRFDVSGCTGNAACEIGELLENGYQATAEELLPLLTKMVREERTLSPAATKPREDARAVGADRIGGSPGSSGLADGSGEVPFR